LSPVDYESYVEGLTQFDVEIVERVCHEIGLVTPDEYQPRFPLLATIREQCFRHEEVERSRVLALKAPMYTDKPVSPEKWAKFRQEVEARVRRTRMR
jgi:hypothetical protein